MPRTHFLYAIVVLLLISSTFTFVHASSQKHKTLLNLAKKEKLIPLKPVQYEKYINTKRDYTVLLLVTVNPDHEDKCPGCQPAQESLENVVDVLKSKGVYPRTEQSFFFAKLEYTRSSSDIISRLGVPGVPKIILFNEGEGESEAIHWTDSSGDLVKFIEENSKVPLIKMDSGAEAGAGLGGAGGGNSDSSMDKDDLWYYGMLSLPLISIVLLYTLFTGSLLRFLRSKTFIYIAGTIALCTYFLCISGTMFNIINTPPKFYSRGGHTFWIYPRHGMQFQYEGYIAGALNAAAGLSLISLHAFIPSIKSGPLKFLVFLCLSIIAAGSFSLVIKVYMTKNPGYLTGALGHL
eukprot:gb/GECH01014198.1/.p1 GENE.gb/GECH01014198.1/~~gb/GECH01014198.1/.p1  ORF type:complete len:349 (+),score=57.21 gb/GECH01014198.1/:1-1047(+)